MKSARDLAIVDGRRMSHEIIYPRDGGVQSFWIAPDGTLPPMLARARGVEVFDASGRRYLDVTAGPAAVNLGHGNERVLAAMREQAVRATFAYPSSFVSEANLRLGAALRDLAGPPFEHAFFVSSGSEAVEKCLQFARRHALATGQPQRHQVISRNPCYHGSTVATMALSADPVYAAYLGSHAGVTHVNAPWSYRVPDGISPEMHADECAEALRAAIVGLGPDSVLAFIIEPVMGFCGGATFAPPGYYRRIREICDEFGVLLIFDETISGSGRTGRFLAAANWPDGRPDLVVLAKGLGSGYYPLAAFLAPAPMVELVARNGGFHLGHTYKANPLGCAVADAVLDELVAGRLMDRATQRGQYLRDRMRHACRNNVLVGDVRGMGLLNAVEIVADRETRAMLPRKLDVLGRVKSLALSRGLLIYGRRTHGGRFGDWIMLTPPLIVSEAELDEMVDGLAATLADYERELAASRG
ncbi:MAG: aminotransferase class III-fold pyridoxal phosphate-dependent enzyme [Steroidobacteraceae bacterium]